MIVIAKHKLDPNDCWNCDYFTNDDRTTYCRLFMVRLKNKRINKTEHAFKSVRTRKCWHGQWAAEKMK